MKNVQVKLHVTDMLRKVNYDCYCSSTIQGYVTVKYVYIVNINQKDTD